MRRPPLQRSWALGLLVSMTMVNACTYGQAPVPDARDEVAAQAARNALNLVGAPYRYGGATPSKGFDCSGLIQYSYRKAGFHAPRTTRAQRMSTRSVSQYQLKAGDLLFFNQEGKRSGHVGIYVGNNRFVHAPSSGKTVRVDRLDSRYWRRHLTSARRFNDI